MLVAFLRTAILYITVIFGVRLMGKRQLGELQPSELVVTIIISNIATLPIEEIDTPLFLGLLPILSIVTFEILISSAGVKWKSVRRILSGSPAVIIRDGVIDQKKLRHLRYSAEDLMAQLRSQNIFDPSEVDFALVETTGKVSVYQNYSSRPLTPQTMGMPDKPQKDNPPYLLVSEGKINQAYLLLAKKDRQWVESTAAAHHQKLEDIFLLLLDSQGKVTLIPREKENVS